MASTTFATPVRNQHQYIQTYDAQVFANSDVITNNSGTLLSLFMSNKGSATLYLMLFNATAVPSVGAVPTVLPIIVDASDTLRLDLHDGSSTSGGFNGMLFNNGICWAASSTAGTLTVDTTSSMWVTARYL